MKIYTKTGDKGMTRLVDGSCVEKHNPWVEAYGTVDELNSFLGIVATSLEPYPLSQKDIQKIQHHLFRVGSLVACGSEISPESFQQLPQITDEHISFLESKIDLMTLKLPELKNFILPAGTSVISQIHYCRTICRRSERRVSEVYSLSNQRLSPVLIYLNRLSDYLFTLSRFMAVEMKCEEIKWDKSE